MISLTRSIDVCAISYLGDVDVNRKIVSTTRVRWYVHDAPLKTANALPESLRD